MEGGLGRRGTIRPCFMRFSGFRICAGLGDGGEGVDLQFLLEGLGS